MSAERTRALRLALPPARRLALPVLLGALSAGSTIALLAASAWLIARAAEQPPILYLSLGVVGVRAFAIGRGVFRYLERLTGHDAAFRQLSELRVGMVRRIVPLAPDGLAATRRGDLLARFTGDVDELQDLPLRVVQPVASAVVAILATLVGLALLVPASALAVGLVLAGGLLAATLGQGVLSARAERRVAPLRGDLVDAVLAHVQALPTLVAYGADGASLRRVTTADARLRRARVRAALGSGLAAAAMAIAAGAAVLAAVAGAAGPLEDGTLSGPQFAIVALVPLALLEVAGAVPVAWATWRTVRASAQRVDGAVPSEPPAGLPTSMPEPVALPAADRPPLLELREVRAAWPDLDATGAGRALTGVDLVVRPGERLLVRGPSGAGKTTLAHVLVGFLAYEGSYRLDGVEVRAADADRVRERIGLCEQRPWLFDTDIRQNLKFARDDADDAELLAVLDRVGLGAWVAERGGLDASVGERGALVSGGQAQRIALARAMLADFPVLVLDEPTANVDRERADALLADLLAAGADGRTVILISHDVVDPALVDRTVTCAAGRIPAARPDLRR
ncbi:thiol reductant ABC exporter subunit CydC [Agromyces sp. SYSU T00194]|uniref:thiol reductant ABC exporter subunit CydC n=1 Tax=Agromyces chitinivorans TaxID=3158560 RepID=UPI003399C2E5